MVAGSAVAGIPGASLLPAPSAPNVKVQKEKKRIQKTHKKERKTKRKSSKGKVQKERTILDKEESQKANFVLKDRTVKDKQKKKSETIGKASKAKTAAELDTFANKNRSPPKILENFPDCGKSISIGSEEISPWQGALYAIDLKSKKEKFISSVALLSVTSKDFPHYPTIIISSGGIIDPYKFDLVLNEVKVIGDNEMNSYDFEKMVLKFIFTDDFMISLFISGNEG